MPLGASPGQAAAFAVTAGLNITAALLAWRLYQNTLAAEREANALAQAATAAKSAFVAMVSHELRTPMTSIRSFSEILRDAKGLNPEEKTRYASIIHSETIRLTRLLDDLLDLSVLENGEVTLNRQSGTLQELLDRAITTAGAAATRSVVIDRDRNSENIQLETDLDRLGQVFINLITNAQKYCGADQPELKIRARLIDGCVEVDMIDNGTGIEPASRDLIFEKFSRVPGQGGEGAGLGLAICREIITRLQGTINYMPDVPGTGFRIRLPQTHSVQETKPKILMDQA